MTGGPSSANIKPGAGHENKNKGCRPVFWVFGSIWIRQEKWQPSSKSPAGLCTPCIETLCLGKSNQYRRDPWGGLAGALNHPSRIKVFEQSFFSVSDSLTCYWKINFIIFFNPISPAFNTELHQREKHRIMQTTLSYWGKMHAFKTSLRPSPHTAQNNSVLNKMPQCKLPDKLKWFYLVFHFFWSAQSLPSGLRHKTNMKFYCKPYDTSRSRESWKQHECLILGTKVKHSPLLYYLFSCAFVKPRPPSACLSQQLLQWCLLTGTASQPNPCK